MAEQRLIDADQLQNIIYKFYCRRCRETGCDRCRGCKVYNILGFMKKLCGTVEAKPVVHAHWEEQIIDGGQELMCSNCGEYALLNGEFYSDFSKYCPFCGAQMDEDVSETKGERQ